MCRKKGIRAGVFFEEPQTLIICTVILEGKKIDNLSVFPLTVLKPDAEMNTCHRNVGGGIRFQAS